MDRPLEAENTALRRQPGMPTLPRAGSKLRLLLDLVCETPGIRTGALALAIYGKDSAYTRVLVKQLRRALHRWSYTITVIDYHGLRGIGGRNYLDGTEAQEHTDGEHNDNHRP